MIKSCFGPDIIDTIEKLGSLIIGIITLRILIAGYYKFLQNQLRNKQLEVVTELVRQIQQIDWHYLHFNNFDNLPLKYRIVTLFDIAEMEEFDECDNLFFWGLDIEQSEEDLLSWNFFNKFYSHPFLPISIAKPLKQFSFWEEQKHITYEEAKSKKYISVGRKKIIPNDAYFFYLEKGNMKSGKEFKKLAMELRNAIIKWAEKYGLDDLNITTSHRNNNLK